MADVMLVQDDTRPSLEGTIWKTRTKDPLDLTNAVGVKFQMRKPDDRKYTVDAAAVIVDAEAGQVRYDWQAGDLHNEGTYQCQWEIDWGLGAIQTTTPVNTIEVRRQ